MHSTLLLSFHLLPSEKLNCQQERSEVYWAPYFTSGSSLTAHPSANIALLWLIHQLLIANQLLPTISPLSKGGMDLEPACKM